MKNLILISVLAVIGLTNAKLQCTIPYMEDTNVVEWKTFDGDCLTEMETQIQMEFNASMTYLSLGAYFSRDTINRPGFAKFFFDAAGEEREHGIKLIEYLSMRGNLNVDNLIDRKKLLAEGQTIAIISPLDALKKALEKEISVTKSIRKVIKACEAGQNDYHLVDYLTGVYLEEQHEGQRDLAGKISTLSKIVKEKGELGEFLYDKTLL
uniref:Ferritin n=1 Tax=Corethrella appendiculata TaxID=1370023 RepID=U5ET00_9DIPT